MSGEGSPAVPEPEQVVTEEAEAVAVPLYIQDGATGENKLVAKVFMVPGR